MLKFIKSYFLLCYHIDLGFIHFDKAVVLFIVIYFFNFTRSFIMLFFDIAKGIVGQE